MFYLPWPILSPLLWQNFTGSTEPYPSERKKGKNNHKVHEAHEEKEVKKGRSVLDAVEDVDQALGHHEKGITTDSHNTESDVAI